MLPIDDGPRLSDAVAVVNGINARRPRRAPSSITLQQEWHEQILHSAVTFSSRFAGPYERKGQLPANHRNKVVVARTRELQYGAYKSYAPTRRHSVHALDGRYRRYCDRRLRADSWIILLAPPERQRAICDHVLREIGDIVDHVLNDDKSTDC